VKLLSVILVVGLGAASCLLAEDKAPAVAGNWHLSLDTPHGPMGGTLLLKQDGAKLSGTCEVEHMGTLGLTGSMDNAKVSLSIELPGGEIFKLLGSVEGSKMSGTTDPEGGKWTADRKE
jgi:hypothetical protein